LGRSLAGLLIALAIARWLQNHGPFHPRPLSEPALTLKVFSADDPNYFRKWNSFPSDHAVQFCAMSFAIATRQFWVGLCAFAWSFLVILLPRLYFGYHYPSGIAAGAALGMSVMAVALWAPAPPRLAMAIHQLGERYSGLRQAALFVISAEVAQNFDDLRALLQALKVV
jgi:undecaprenyl-diphosphatase